MDREKFEPRNKESLRERLERMKEADRRNEQRRREFVEKEKYNEKLFELYVEGRITREQFESRFKK